MDEHKWEQQRRRRKMQQDYQREESRKRAELRPLRSAVNACLKRAGIPHSVTIYSSRVKGWPTSQSAGWETESVYWAEPKYIQVEINVGHFENGDPHKALYALKTDGFDADLVNERIRVYQKESHGG
jgi:hypothetical protein